VLLELKLANEKYLGERVENRKLEEQIAMLTQNLQEM